MENIYVAKKTIKQEKRLERLRKYKKCEICGKYITKHNFSRHILKQHYKDIKNKEKKLLTISKLFNENKNDIIDKLYDLKNLLIRAINFDVKTIKRRMKNTIWHKIYKKI